MIIKTAKGWSFRTRFLFFQLSSRGETDVWAVYNKKTTDLLGECRWHAPRRQYCFYPRCYFHWGEVVLNANCLTDIIDLLAALKRDRRAGQSGRMKHEAHQTAA